MAKRIVLVTGGMGGLGESICTKMADAGYTVVTTHSPSNKTSGAWLTAMKQRGYEFHGYAADVADFDSCAACAKTLPMCFLPAAWTNGLALIACSAKGPRLFSARRKRSARLMNY